MAQMAILLPDYNCQSGSLSLAQLAKPWETTGMVVLQSREREVASINMAELAQETVQVAQALESR